MVAVVAAVVVAEWCNTINIKHNVSIENFVHNKNHMKQECFLKPIIL